MVPMLLSNFVTSYFLLSSAFLLPVSLPPSCFQRLVIEHAQSTHHVVPTPSHPHPVLEIQFLISSRYSTWQTYSRLKNTSFSTEQIHKMGDEDWDDGDVSLNLISIESN